ncbi:PREDICTED: uncharacterized protein LOC106810923 [Priapulus caudatus]|uniref:Uncharacterized protein LOC106810923 n=1 Tax=Priapulus caudatus TaxID=37621 RepID=A0ABM1ECH1_PRICU|nr:PREDICTED: uncharacterized protein LOC106810923 [Priapulus caudatus]XP_014669892.1 PREDICTED: uncharacterized protein LOC106810923 [Priapulus caudatus]XP_014669893.1 PREDICTED: uncharacterized protein LOC106810923 [Priapulus caudatus]
MAVAGRSWRILGLWRTLVRIPTTVVLQEGRRCICTTPLRLTRLAALTRNKHRMMGHKEHGQIITRAVKQPRSITSSMLGYGVENNYLAWLRNCFNITVVIGFVYGHHISVPISDKAKNAFFLLASLNMVFGTAIFFYNSYKLSATLQLGRVMATVSMGTATLNLAVWIIGVALYLELISPSSLLKKPSQHNAGCK